MRYFFLAYALIALLVVAVLGIPGSKTTKPPIRVFPDMDDQDKLRAQRPDRFFDDGHGGRIPVARTHPRGFNPNGAQASGGIPEYEFGGAGTYYASGQIGDYFGNGLPEELQLGDKALEGLIRRGGDRYQIHCAPCHGTSGDGQGIATVYGVPAPSNPNAKLNSLTRDSYPDGRLFYTITHGMGRMGAYGYHLPLRDRWAIVAYLRTMQAAKQSTPPPAK